MSRYVALCLVLGLVALSGASAATRQAYRPDAQALVREVVSSLKDWMTPNVGVHPSAYDAFADDAEKFHLVVKFVVPPKHTKDFAKTWLDAKEELEGQEGNQKMKLFKIFTDNTCLVSYQEWDSMKSFKEACKSDKGKKLKEFICEKDIPVFLCGMCPIDKSGPEAFLSTNNIADASNFEDEDLHAGMMAPHELEAALAEHRNGGEGECKPTVISKYCVPPSCKEKFIKGFLKTKSKVLEGEKGVKCYGLAKTLSDNIKYLGYEEWESKEALHEHIKSDNFKEFCSFIFENNLPMKLCMAIPIESEEQLEFW